MQRIYLITPPLIDPGTFAGDLNQALNAGDIAAVLIASGNTDGERLEAAKVLVPMIQDHGSAAIILNCASVAEETGADGVQIDEGDGQLQDALSHFKPDRIVGAGGVSSRDRALEWGERDVDYLFFGDPLETSQAQPSEKALELATWWSEFTQVPAVIMAGDSLSTFEDALNTEADFIAVNQLVWNHEGGPSDAVSRLSEALVAREPA